MLSVARHDSFEDLRASWGPLLATAQARGPFLDWRWQSLWWQTFAGEEALWLLAVREGDALLGIAPLMAANGRLSFACGCDVSDYLDIIAQRGREAEVAAAVAAYLREQNWSQITLHSLHPEAAALRYLPAGLTGERIVVRHEREDVCPGVDLPGDWESYLAALSKKDRHELRRKLRRLGQGGQAQSYVLVDGEIGPREVDDFLALLRLSSPEKAAFMDERMERFFRGIFASYAHDGLLRLYLLELDGRRVATALCFDWRGELLLYNSGYDPALAPLSVGLLLKAFCVQDAIALGRRRFDFLRGDERYKYDLGGRDVPVFRLLVERRS